MVKAIGAVFVALILLPLAAVAGGRPDDRNYLSRVEGSDLIKRQP